MAFCLPVLPPQEQAQKGAGQRRDEGVGRGKGAGCAFGAGSGPEGLGLELAAREGGAPLGIDDGGDAGIGAADEPATLLDAAQARGVLYIPPQVDVYMGMIVGLSKKDELDINVCREKQLTNMRTHASDGAIQLTPYTQLSLEQCLDFLMEDELLEVTPKSLRLRKKELNPTMRKRQRNHQL